MDIKTATIEQIEERIAEIKALDLETVEDRTALIAEIDSLNARKEELRTIAKEKQELRDKVANSKEVKEIEKPQERKGETEMNEIELRNTAEYGKAFVKAMMTGDEKEARALLSTNVVGGSLPVPEHLENEIKNAWEDCKLASLCKRTSYKGNVKVGFEYSATGAVVHVEGEDAPTEETLVYGVIELKAESIKKWITVSDEAIENTTIDTLGEIYKEIAQRIVEKAEQLIVAKIVAAPAASTTTAADVPVYNASTADIDTIVMALAELSGQAKNVTLAMNRRTYAAFKSLQLKNKYAVDPFDGCPVVFTDALTAYAAATSGDTYVIVGDFGYGFQLNMPNGNDMTIKTDDLSLAEKDLVKVVGRQFVGMGVVAPKAFVKITK